MDGDIEVTPTWPGQCFTPDELAQRDARVRREALDSVRDGAIGLRDRYGPCGAIMGTLSFLDARIAAARAQEGAETPAPGGFHCTHCGGEWGTLKDFGLHRCGPLDIADIARLEERLEEFSNVQERCDALQSRLGDALLRLFALEARPSANAQIAAALRRVADKWATDMLTGQDCLRAVAADLEGGERDALSTAAGDILVGGSSTHFRWDATSEQLKMESVSTPTPEAVALADKTIKKIWEYLYDKCHYRGATTEEIHAAFAYTRRALHLDGGAE